jgi:hypothetical protein
MLTRRKLNVTATQFKTTCMIHTTTKKTTFGHLIQPHVAKFSHIANKWTPTASQLKIYCISDKHTNTSTLQQVIDLTCELVESCVPQMNTYCITILE